MLEIDLFVPVQPDVVERVGDDGEVSKPQEVHLDQAQRLARRIVELRDDLSVLLALHDRDDVEQRLGRHDHAGRVHTPLSLQPLEPESAVEDRLRLGVGLDDSPELAGLLVARMRGVEHAVQRHVLAHHGRRHGLGQTLPHAEREAEHPPRVLQRLLRLDRAIRDDLRHALVAVLLGDVVDDLAATAVVEIDVEVGHGDAVGVEETLEDESVLEGIEIGDLHGVGDHGPGAGTAARPDADSVVLGPVDEVGDHEEVTREAHLQDDAGLVLGLLAHLVGDAVGIPVMQPRLDLLDQPAVLGLAVGHREARHVVRRGVEFDLAALSDEQRVVACLRVIAEQLAHLLRRLDVIAVTVELEAVRVVHRRTRLHAQQRFVSVCLVLVRIVRVVGADERDVEIFRELQQVAHDAALDGESVIHDLGEVVLFAEDVLEFGSGGARGVILPEAQAGLDLAGRTPGRRDQTLTVLLEQFTVHARLEVITLDARERTQPEQVVHALGALTPHGHVGVGTGSGDVVALLFG